MAHARWILGVGLAFGLAPRLAHAQLTIQQPVFGVNSVATTVSVPDRGRAFLGGVSRAGDSRTTNGPLRSGTNSGFFREASSMSVTATIHDFEAMDEYLLSQPTRTSGSVAAFHVDDPYQQLLARSQRRGLAAVAAPREMLAGSVLCNGRCAAAVPASLPRAPDEVPHPPEPKGAADGGETSYRLGLSAEDRGAAGVAKLHYRLAARRGHALAQSRLATLSDASAPTKVAGTP